ncbi:hypothetical protein QA436_000096 [Escherichia coli]|nr:hypothetical protein [Escherichia coli]
MMAMDIFIIIRLSVILIGDFMVNMNTREVRTLRRPFLLHDLSESASHQIPDRQYPHLIRCGYGAGALCKKENPLNGGLRENGRP